MKRIKVLTHNHFLCDLFFSIYLKLRRYAEQWKHDVYDHLGLIDTLGCQGSNGKLTGSYHDELNSMYWIKLPFQFCLVYSDDFEQSLTLTKIVSL